MNKMPQMDEFQVDRFADGMDAAWSNLVELAKMISVNKAAGTLTIRNGRSKIVLRQDGVIRVEGTSSLILVHASSPLRLGMRTSSSTTSGTVSWASSMALLPSPASPTTSMSGSTPSSMVSPRRNSSWSSTTTTRTDSARDFSSDTRES